MTKTTPVVKNRTLTTTGKKKESLQAVLDEMQQVVAVPATAAENEICVKDYNRRTSALRRAYKEALQKEDLEEVYAFNRKMGPMMQQMHGLVKHSGLYAMGMFSGVFVAMSDMLPQRNDEQIFNMYMAELRERAYVKQIIKILYEDGYVQHKQMCNRINVSASQLTRSMSELIRIGCVRRYRSGKASVYMLTARGEKYAREFLGYKRRDLSKYAQVRLTGKKPQIERRERRALMDNGDQAEAYKLSNKEGRACVDKQFWADKMRERGIAYE